MFALAGRRGSGLEMSIYTVSEIAFYLVIGLGLVGVHFWERWNIREWQREFSSVPDHILRQRLADPSEGASIHRLIRQELNSRDAAPEAGTPTPPNRPRD